MPELALSIQGGASFARLPARSTLARWIRAALRCDAELTLRFVGAREGHRLNRDFRGRDYATDVLTFGYSTSPVIRADIVICVPIVKRTARALSKPFSDHLAHLCIHAVLHAQGYRHDAAIDARTMQARETRILRALGKCDPYVEGSYGVRATSHPAVVPRRSARPLRRSGA